MMAMKDSVSTTAKSPLAPKRSLAQFFSPLEELADHSPSLASASLGHFNVNGETHELRRYLHVGPRGGDAPIRLGIFAGIHGDEAAPAYAIRRFLRLLEDTPDIAQGYCLFFYPILNPTGFVDNTRHSRRGRDLNREFWRNTSEPEVALLERELRSQAFHGLISLHSDDTSHGLYGFVDGNTLTENLLRPALREAAAVLPVNEGPHIDGFHAREGIIRSGYDGVLSAPPEQRPRPFDLIFETPQLAPQYLQEQALILSLQVILRKYRNLMAYAPNL